MEDRCICCGEIIPEGRQVCPTCEYVNGLGEIRKREFYEGLLDHYGKFGLKDISKKEIENYIALKEKNCPR